MDVSLSIVTGLGLRLFLASAAATDAGPSNKLATALLGVWEGAVVHQVSGRSTSPLLDHFLAYGLRLSLDLLVTKDIQRLLMVVVCSAIAAFISEAAVPHASLRTSLKKDREHKERRHRRIRSTQPTVPIVSTPLPPRVRAYRHPEPEVVPTTSTSALLPPQPPQTSSTPMFPPPTPPSFFLQDQENSDIYSPEPKPIRVEVVEQLESSPGDGHPARPRSGIASILETSPESGSPLPVPMPLPTPPESAQSAVPSDGLIDVQSDTNNEAQKQRFEHQLYTIPELSSPENQTTPGIDQPRQVDVVEIVAHPEPAVSIHMSTATNNAPLPVPNADIRRMPSRTLSKWLASQANHTEADTIFATPFSPSMSPAAPLPVRLRQQEESTQTSFAEVEPQPLHSDDEKGGVSDATGSVVEDNLSDELQTPHARNALHLETDNDYDPDPLRTPQEMRPPQDADVLSPLALDMRSSMDEQSVPSRGPTPAAQDPTPAPEGHVEDPFDALEEDLPVPGSLSQNMLLQPPLPPSGPLIRMSTPPPESPPPPSPSTIKSGVSDISILSTRVPSKLYTRGGEIRQEARDKEIIRAQIEEERRRAELEGRPLDALFLKVKVRDMEREAHKLHEKAARRLYAARNTVEISNKIDVHGLRPREAFDRIERAIVKSSHEGKTIVRVIVGKGLHSVNQQPTLKPAVQREMQRLRLPCEVDLRNPGVLNITIPKAPVTNS